LFYNINEMFSAIVSRLGEFAVWLIRWYVTKVKESWKCEYRLLKRTKNKEQRWLWITLCIIYTLFLIPYLAKEAFSTNIMLGLFFLSSAFLAVSFGYILKNPMILIVLYVFVIFRREVTGFFGVAKDTAMSGDILGAIVLIGLAIYLIWKTKQIESEFKK